MRVYHRDRAPSTHIGIVSLLVLPALLALWVLWIWLGYSPTGGIGLLHP